MADHPHGGDPVPMAWVFASLTPAISFALVAVTVLMLVGVVLAAVIRRSQAYLLRWQQHNRAD
jgi:NitT/TauT family transport system permease protein